MKYTSIEQFLSAVQNSAVSVCSVTRDCVYSFSSAAADCVWSENDFVITATESKSCISIDKNELISIEKTDYMDCVEYEVKTNNSVITIDVFKKGGEQ